MLEDIKKLNEKGKSVEEIVKELEVKESLVYRVLNEGNDKKEGIKGMNKSDMIRIVYLFDSGMSVKDISKLLVSNYSWVWRLINKMNKDNSLMEKIYKKYEDMVEDEGIEKLKSKFENECKRRKKEKEKKEDE